MKKFPLPELQANFICYSRYHDNINMNQDSSINSIAKAQNITRAITNNEVRPTSKENTKNKHDIENEGNICQKSTE